MRPKIALSLCGIVLISTGCGTRARLEYDRAYFVTETSDWGDHRRESTVRAIRGVFEIASERQSSKEQPSQSDDQGVVGRANEPAKSVPTIHIEIGTINLHVGDVNVTHDHSQSTQKAEVIQPCLTPTDAVGAPLPTPGEQIPQRNSRCDPLRRQHEKTLAEWERLFR